MEQIRPWLDKPLHFEKEFYASYDFEVEFLGHPLLDAVSNHKLHHSSTKQKWKIEGRPLIALLPGSRTQELNKMLPKMLEVQKHFMHCDFIIAGVEALGEDYYQSFLKDSNISVIFNNTYLIFEEADAALVSSGTATLEAALYNVPQIVCYKTDLLTFYLAKILVKIQWISLNFSTCDEEPNFFIKCSESLLQNLTSSANCEKLR